MIIRLIRWVFFGFILHFLGIVAVGGLIIYYAFFADFNPKETANYWLEKIKATKIDVNIEKDGQETEYSLYQEDDQLKFEKN